MIILLQGAMKEEVNVFIEHYNPTETKNINGYDFYILSYNEHKIIISQTKEGIINTTIATMIAINEFKPDIVINQGCAGGHTLKAKQGDIFVAEKSVYINDFKSTAKAKGDGSNSLDWQPNIKRCYVVESTKELIEIAKNIDANTKLGTLGSGDLLSREYDRIIHLNGLFHEDCEDMESIAALKVCETFGIDKIAFRIISNNELLLQPMDKSLCAKMQNFTIKFVDKLIKCKSR